MFAAPADSLHSSLANPMRYFALHRNPRVHAGVRRRPTRQAVDTQKKKATHMPGVGRRACPQPSRPAVEDARKQAQRELRPARLAAQT